MNSASKNLPEKSSWIESIKENFKKCTDSFDLNTCKIIELIAYFGVGIFIGFLLKRYAKIFIISLVCILIALFLLDNFKIIEIDWLKIRTVTGINPSATIGNLLKTYVNWIKVNLLTVISALVGFLIGYKIG